jgi:hypothetical protein
VFEENVMELNDIGEIIATRKLVLVDFPGQEVQVKMGRPQVSKHRDFCCPVQIDGIGDERIHRIFGADAFHSIQLAIDFIGSVLEAWSEQQGRKLRWESDEGGGVGFPPTKKG